MLMPNVIAATDYRAQRVQIQTSLVEDINPPGSPAGVGFRLEASGPPYNEQIKEGAVASYVTVGPWVLIGVPTDYEVRYSGSGASLTGSPINVWLDFSETRFWQLTVSGALGVFTGTIELRQASDSFLLLSQPLTLRADNR